MPTNHSTTDRPGAADREEIDRCAEAFQSALNRGQRPTLEDYLPSNSDATRVLVELVHVELEFRLKRGEAARVEEYLVRYPQLAGDPASVVDLAAAEYNFRRRHEPALSWESYAQRFPVCRDAFARQPLVVNVLAAPEENESPAVSTVRMRPPTLASGSLPLESAIEFRRILHRRLRVLSLLYGIFLAYFFAVPALLQIELGFHHVYSAAGLASGSAALLLTGGLGVWLLKRSLPSLGALRMTELLLHGCLILVFATWQYEELIHLQTHPLWGQQDEDAVIRPIAYSIHVNWFLAIIVYGTLIPNTWQRCAAVCLTTALVPFLIHWAALPSADVGRLLPKLAAGCTTAVGLATGLAVFGSYSIDALRQEIRIIRQQVRALGQYRLKRRLGGGSMGEVYLAEHALLKRPCAVKCIRPEIAVHPSYLARFEREVQAMARLAHPNIVEIYDYGRSEDGTFYYAMEYLPGLDLHQLVAQAGPLPPGRAVYFLRQISAALHEAHARGLIHRDVKPSNILVTERGGSNDFIKLLDFGLVRGHEDRQGQLTQTGLILGTPGFMSPEQAAGETALDARSDIYSVGAVAYFLLSGRAPFAGKPAGKLIAAHILESPPPLQDLCRDVPEDLACVVARCLAKGAAERFPDAGQLEQAFAACACATEWSKEDASDWWRTRRTAEPPAHAESQA